MFREFDKQPDGTVLVRYILEMDQEIGQYERAYPHEMPAGHRLAYRWGTKDKRPYVETFIEPDPSYFVKPADEGTTPAAATPGVDDAERKRLEALPEAERLSIAAELNLGNSVKKDQAAAKQAGAIIEARKAKSEKK